ncbi:uncharacterized protein [Penaeus vannamei]|uniref:uncharacterized protein n=1 Tax=Penaeus vannamei TaxID=6689 RepID=UPI00387F8828
MKNLKILRILRNLRTEDSERGEGDWRMRGIGSPYFAGALYPGSGPSSDAPASSVPVGVDAGVSLALASLMPPTLPLLPPAAAAAAAAAAALMPYHPHVSASQATSSSVGVGSHMAALSARAQPPPPAARHLHCGPGHSSPAARPRGARTSAFTVEELLKDRRSPSEDASARPHFPVIVSSLYGARAPPSPPSGDEQSPQRTPGPARAAPPSLPPSPPAIIAASSPPPASPGAPRGLDGLLRRPAAHAPPTSPPSPPSPARRGDRLPSPLSRRPLARSSFPPAGSSPAGARPQAAASPRPPAPSAPAGSPRPSASPARPSSPPPPPLPSSPAAAASTQPPPTAQAPAPAPTECPRPSLPVSRCFCSLQVEKKRRLFSQSECRTQCIREAARTRKVNSVIARVHCIYNLLRITSLLFRFNIGF